MTDHPDAANDAKPRGFGAHAWQPPEEDTQTTTPAPSSDASQPQHAWDASPSDASSSYNSQPLPAQTPYGAPAQPNDSAASQPYTAPTQAPYGTPSQPYGSPAQPTGTQPFGGGPSPYGNPAQPNSAGAQPYGTAPQPPYGNQNPYGTPAPYGNYSQNPPANPYAYSPQTMPNAPAAPKSSLLGIIALSVVVLTAIIGTVLSYQFGYAYGDLLDQVGITSGTMPSSTDLQDDPRFTRFITSQMGALQGIGLACLIGTVAWITSIVATATRRGRSFGIIGIVVGVLAPIIIFVAMAVAMASGLS